MISNKDAKFIKSLQLKKYRAKEGAFLVEGEKNLLELLASDLSIRQLYVTPAFSEAHSTPLVSTAYEPATERELTKVGTFQSNNAGLAVAEIPRHALLNVNSGFYLAFDNLQDPGNLGTIIRTADWYGFTDIVCSLDSVDAYNPKVVNATMGSFARVRVHYVDLHSLLSAANTPVYGASLSGSNLHEQTFGNDGIMVFGNESQGIRPELTKLISHQIKIPGYGGAESLNVAVSTAVVCDNLRRLIR